MGLHKGFDENMFINENAYEEDFDSIEPIEEKDHKKRVRKMLEERLERKRLKEELEDEFDSDFEWDDYNK